MGALGVTVVIPAFNAAGTIERAVRSVVAQTRQPERVVIVDNGSDDGTGEVLNALKKELGDFISVVREAERGAAAARNAGLRAAESQWVAFLDADDEWSPAKLAAIEGSLVAGNVIVAHEVANVWKDGRRKRLNCLRGRERHEDAFVALMFGNFLATSSVVVQTAAAKWHGGFDQSLVVAEDYALWLALAEKGPGDIVVLPGTLGLRHVSDDSLSGRCSAKGAVWKLRRQYFLRLLERPSFWSVRGWFRLMGRAGRKVLG